MKKSEMIKIIKGCIWDICSHGEYIEDIDYEHLAKILLDKIEKKGMIPPSTEFKMGDKTYRDNGWEPEDEE